MLRVFSFTRPIRGSGHVQGIYPQACPETRFLCKSSSAILGSDGPRSDFILAY